MRVRWFVGQRSAVRPGVRLRDRQAEAGALARIGCAAGEALEDAADVVRRDAASAILDGHPQLSPNRR